MYYSPEVVRRFMATAAPASLPPEGQRDLRDGTRTQSSRRRGPASSDTAEWAAAVAEDKTLNVWIRFHVEVAHGIIRGVAHEVFGCPHTVAAASWTADWLLGGPVERLRQLDVQRLSQVLAVPVEKLGKLLRIEDALLGCWARLEAVSEPVRGSTGRGAASSSGGSEAGCSTGSSWPASAARSI